MGYHVSGRRGLLEILSRARPHGSETEHAFCRKFIDRVPGMTSDRFGNRIIAIGDTPRVMWSCHIDTVAARDGPQDVFIDHKDIARLRNGKSGMSLGADDGAGLWIMLNMVAAGRPGLYVFHRGEELGCLGSGWIEKHTPHLLEDIDAAIAFDRAGLADVITHQASGRTCSDAFAASLAASLNALDPNFAYRPDDTGIFTDTNEYAGIVPECTNLSVGYYSQHGPRETLDVAHCEKLLAVMLRFDASRLVIRRDPSIRTAAHCGWDEQDRADCEDLASLLAEYPRLAAEFLLEAGFTADDFWLEAWERDRGEAFGCRAHPIS